MYSDEEYDDISEEREYKFCFCCRKIIGELEYMEKETEEEKEVCAECEKKYKSRKYDVKICGECGKLYKIFPYKAVGRKGETEIGICENCNSKKGKDKE